MSGLCAADGRAPISARITVDLQREVRHSPGMTTDDQLTSPSQQSDPGHDAGAQTVAGRRRLLRLAGAAAAGAAIGALGDRSSVRAANNDPILIARVNQGSDVTYLFDSPFYADGHFSSYPVLRGSNTSATATAIGVLGESLGSAGVAGRSATGDAPAFLGRTGVDGWGGAYGAVGRSSVGVGVLGESTDGGGVVGRSSTAAGVTGVSSSSAGVEAYSTSSIDLRCTGSGRMWMAAHTSSGAPTVGGHSAGEVIRDDQGNFFVCVAGDGTTAGSWRRIGGPATAGQFHAVDPFRAYDSRRTTYPLSGPLAMDASRVISVKDARDGAGVITEADVIPVGATAVSYNITVINPTSPGGFLAVAPGNAASTAVASVNWFGAGQTIGNASVVRLDGNRQVKVFAGGQPGAAGFAIDVVGYYA
jgi:hypothetical protein